VLLGFKETKVMLLLIFQTIYQVATTIIRINSEEISQIARICRRIGWMFGAQRKIIITITIISSSS